MESGGHGNNEEQQQEGTHLSVGSFAQAMVAMDGVSGSGPPANSPSSSSAQHTDESKSLTLITGVSQSVEVK